MSVKTFTIDRSRWLRGEVETSMLRNTYGDRCCLGFYLGACGVSDSAMTDEATPSDVRDVIPEEAQWLLRTEIWAFDEVVVESGAGAELISVNDDKHRCEDARERDVARLFAERGIEVVFVDHMETT